ncbi:phage integrase-related [Holotrichia oblita]|uniref:Phage integrase-related n=1 Tax=Holotrichia oblita TaxID=644536 RepID=A0ACB9T2S5_HOLOL|nr:phage integrase-related [Holotrichia oblita]
MGADGSAKFDNTFVLAKGLGNAPIKTFASEVKVSEHILNADIHVVPDEVILIIGIAGACRTDELCNMKVAHVDLRKDIIVINIPHTKNKSCRKFVIVEPMWIDVVTRYVLIRPSPDIPRLFIGFRSGKPTRQNMGHNTISTSAIKIVTYLKLPDANNYTGHSFRRTSATILADNGGDILSLKRHGRWKSSTVAEVYVEDSITDKKRIVSMVQGTTVNYEPDLPPSTSIFEVTPSTLTSVSKSNTELNIPVENFTSNTVGDTEPRKCANGATRYCFTETSWKKEALIEWINLKEIVAVDSTDPNRAKNVISM